MLPLFSYRRIRFYRLYLIAVLIFNVGWSSAFAQTALPVQQVSLVDGTGANLSDTAITDLLRPIGTSLIGTSLTNEQIDAAAMKMSKLTREAGWVISRVVVTDADVTELANTGTLRFTVFKGAVGKISVQNTSKVHDQRIVNTIAAALCDGIDVAGKCTGNKALNAFDLERAQLLVGDIPGVLVSPPTLSPDGVEVGQTHLTEVATILGDPVIYGLTVDNYGPKSIGEGRITGTVLASNVFGEGDILKVLGTVTNKNYDSGNVDISFPVGYYGWRAYVDYLRNHFVINNSELAGDSSALSGGVSYPIYRAYGYNVKVNLGLSDGNGRSTFGGSVLGDLTTKFTQLGITLDDGDRRRIAGESFTTAILTINDGRLNINDAASLEVDAKTAHTQGRFVKTDYSLQRKQNLYDSVDGLYLLVNLHGQFASKNLSAGENLSSGGISAVRAYPVEETTANAGHVLQLDLKRPFSSGDVALTSGIFLDAAHIKIDQNPWPQSGKAVTTPENSRHLYGAGLALEGTFGTNVSFGLMWAFQLGSEPSVAEPNGSRSRLWANLSFQF
ncbi:ShlB/FhaC/HecB family hemolysin secretion/activation protein [Sapientia aquatica]|uniref:ShlB/FhaC/HecB family hemolysin secretion/activation protein n=1 Tax=Sapientia aquatica TaxID=1549640 RepID=A0A4R5VWM2_9BURK|nr:ShlB/FhaC/HecB family hemolysin secretion/activation protein [Sapientia aquatica]TDK63745.1 ShlB/FhaC/HecB family hemolysin secretion/activation protein [Sapientia aquatica]